MRADTVRRTTLLAGGALVAMLAAAPALAEETVLEEIVVTAQKRAQSAQDVPIALTAYTGDDLARLGVDQLDKLSNYVPGLQIQLQSPNNPGFVIRGITSDSGSAQEEARVSVFVDGVPASRARGANIEMFDLERVEVLKGPQGTLFGRGAQIGAVSIITAKPDTDAVAINGRVAIGDYGQKTYEAAANVPLNDKVAIRVAGISRDRDGYIDNLAGGEALNGVGVKALRGSFLLLPVERLTVTGIVNYQEDDYTGTSFKNKVFAPQGGDTSPFSAAQLNRGEGLGVDRKLFNATLNAEYEINDALSLTSITAYREFNAWEDFDADGSQAYLLEFAEDAQGTQWSQEFRLNYKVDDKLEGFAGVSYFYEDGFQRVPLSTDERQLAVFNPGGALPFPNFGPIITPAGTLNPLVALLGLPPTAGNPLPFPLPALATGEFTNFGTNKAYEAFADATYHVTEEFSLTGGLRFTHEEQDSAFVQSVSPTAILLPALFPNVARRELSEDFNSVVGRLVATYQPNRDSLFYASVARGRRPAVVQVDATNSEVLKNEIVWSYEAGTKLTFLGDRLRANASAFWYDYSNFQTSVRVPNSALTRVDDAGEARSYGFELTLNARAADWLDLFATYGYINARIDDEDSNGNAQALGGNTFRLTPKHAFSLGGTATYGLDAADAEIFFTPSFTFKSRVYFEDANTPGIEQGPYGLLNLRAGIRSADGRWTATAYVENALDREYLIDAGNTGASFGLPTYIAGPPRFYGVEFAVKF
ncbi:TonB-dependent receptor [Oleisolibacter albus]|uniref:TonB-dependent receptor n=1 Tax=Oleisolibacter albus TaxID=2171757 RepID=UPI000DF12C36|nr:TonB-dependent receptor [Oleisolibacter albus]